MPDWIAAIILGIIEGITEFLPISSTGHLLIAERWLQMPPDLVKDDLFNIVIQCGTVLAVLLVFATRVKQLLTSWRDPVTQDYLAKFSAAFLITAFGGLAMEKFHFKLPEHLAPIAWAMLIGGVLFVVIERWLVARPSNQKITWQIAFGLGLAQLVAAAFPGASRSGATILVALAFGLSRPAATEFSFLLGIPTLLAAGGLKLFKALRHGPDPSVHWGLILLGTLVAAIVAFIAVKWLLRFIQTHTFIGFGWYRIAVGTFLLVLILVQHSS
jgi:undecaprenyl-diphosphatase